MVTTAPGGGNPLGGWTGHPGAACCEASGPEGGRGPTRNDCAKRLTATLAASAQPIPHQLGLLASPASAQTGNARCQLAWRAAAKGRKT